MTNCLELRSISILRTKVPRDGRKARAGQESARSSRRRAKLGQGREIRERAAGESGGPGVGGQLLLQPQPGRQPVRQRMIELEARLSWASRPREEIAPADMGQLMSQNGPPLVVVPGLPVHGQKDERSSPADRGRGCQVGRDAKLHGLARSPSRPEGFPACRARPESSTGLLRDRKPPHRPEAGGQPEQAQRRGCQAQQAPASPPSSSCEGSRAGLAAPGSSPGIPRSVESQPRAAGLESSSRGRGERKGRGFGGRLLLPGLVRAASEVRARTPCRRSATPADSESAPSRPGAEARAPRRRPSRTRVDAAASEPAAGLHRLQTR